MKSVLLGLSALVIASSLHISCKKDKEQAYIIFSASGNIQARLDEFRQQLGAQLNTTPGVTGGRREINWDGVPEQLLAKPLPSNFFNPTEAGSPASRQRGLVYATATGTFEVSKTNFSEVNAAAAAQFNPFSGEQTFTNISSNLWDVGFEVAGQPVAATVKGFGIVFSDVDIPDNSFMEFFSGNESLGKFYVPVRSANSSFSFLGVYFKNANVTRVRVGHGTGVLNTGEKDVSDGGSKDLVILDDFLYDEPIAR